MINVGAVVLAGEGKKRWPYYPGTATCRAELSIGGNLLGHHVAHAVSSVASQVVYVGTTPPDSMVWARPGDTLSQSMYHGAEKLTHTEIEAVLFITADLPFLCQESLQWLLEQAEFAFQSGADTCCIVAHKAHCETLCSGMKRTYARLKDGTLTFGNAVLVRRQSCGRLLRAVNFLYPRRKNPLALMTLLGADTAVRYALAQCGAPSVLSIRQITQRANLASELKLVAIETERPSHASLAQDVDTYAHWQTASVAAGRKK